LVGVTLHKASISPELRAALERRGVDWLRVLLAQTGVGVGAAVNVEDRRTATRAEVEDWLREIAADDTAKQENRHAQMLSIAYWTLGIAVVAAVAGILAAWPVVREWLK
jgi:hypothetical protein